MQASEYAGAHNGKPPSDCAKCCCPLMEIYRYDGCAESCCGLFCMTCIGNVGGAMVGVPLGPCGAWAYMFTCWEPQFVPPPEPDCCMKCFCPLLEVYRYEGCECEPLCMAWCFGCCYTMCCWEPRRMASMQQPMVVVQSQQQQSYSPPIMQMADRNQDVRLTASAPDGFVVMAQAVNPAAESLAAAAHQAEARAAELRAAMPRSEPELAAHGEAFPLTLQDMFTNRFVVEVTPRTSIHEVKELLRLQKDGPVESVDTMLLLFDTQPLDDDTTVGSHGLSAETTVTISNQNPARGREQRRLRGERALRERELQEAEEEAVRARAAADAAASPLASAPSAVATPMMASTPPSTVSPSFTVQAHVGLSLASVLEEAMLTQYGDALREFGAIEWQDLAELEEADAASLGIRRIEFRRLMRVVESHAGT